MGRGDVAHATQAVQAPNRVAEFQAALALGARRQASSCGTRGGSISEAQLLAAATVDCW